MPHRPDIPAPPQVWPAGQSPHSTAPPQLSPMRPQKLAARGVAVGDLLAGGWRRGRAEAGDAGAAADLARPGSRRTPCAAAVVADLAAILAAAAGRAGQPGWCRRRGAAGRRWARRRRRRSRRWCSRRIPACRRSRRRSCRRTAGCRWCSSLACSRRGRRHRRRSAASTSGRLQASRLTTSGRRWTRRPGHGISNESDVACVAPRDDQPRDECTQPSDTPSAIGHALEPTLSTTNRRRPRAPEPAAARAAHTIRGLPGPPALMSVIKPKSGTPRSRLVSATSPRLPVRW